MLETLTYVDLIDAGNAQAQLILLSIGRVANPDTGVCTVSQDDLSRMAKCTSRTVRNYLGKLEQDNLISRNERFDEKGARLTDELTLVGYQEWVNAIRKGGVVKAPVIINTYEQAANLAGTPPANSAGGGSLKDQDNLETPPANLAGSPGKQVAGYKEINDKWINNKCCDFDELQRLLIEAANDCLDNPANCLGLLNLSTPQMWISQGADLHLDIIPTLKACAQRFKGQRVRSWNYFTQPIIAQKKSREAGLAQIEKTKPFVAKKNFNQGSNQTSSNAWADEFFEKWKDKLEEISNEQH